MKTKYQNPVKRVSKNILYWILPIVLGASCSTDTTFTELPSTLTKSELALILGEENLPLVEDVVIERESPLSGYWSHDANHCFYVSEEYYLHQGAVNCASFTPNNGNKDVPILTVQVDGIEPDFYIIARLEPDPSDPDPNAPLGLWISIYYLQKDVDGNPVAAYTTSLQHIINIADHLDDSWDDYKTVNAVGHNWGTFIDDMKDPGFDKDDGTYTKLTKFIAP